jgi:hypothetical protein
LAAYSLEAEAKDPAEPYRPQPGDIFLATDAARWVRIGHSLAGSAGVHHSGIMFLRADGRPALLEAGPFHRFHVEASDPVEQMQKYEACGDRVWIRRRAQPLTAEQSARLTAFAEGQVGKWFAFLRVAGQLTPFRSRGVLRTWWVGKPHKERSSYFCSELVLESCIAAGLVDEAEARPAATYPRDLFFGQSPIPYLDSHLHMEPGWHPPARWTAEAAEP